MSALPPDGAAGVDDLPNENEGVGAEDPEVVVGAAAGLLLKEKPLPKGLAAAGAAGAVEDAGAEGVDDDPNEKPADAAGAGGAGAGAGEAELEEPKAKPPKGEALAGAFAGA